MIEQKYLGKKPKYQYLYGSEALNIEANADHYRQALLEAANELENGANFCIEEGNCFCGKSAKELVKKLRISAGVEE